MNSEFSSPSPMNTLHRPLEKSIYRDIQRSLSSFKEILLDTVTANMERHLQYLEMYDLFLSESDVVLNHVDNKLTGTIYLTFRYDETATDLIKEAQTLLWKVLEQGWDIEGLDMGNNYSGTIQAYKTFELC